jgi:hypothetical protein
MATRRKKRVQDLPVLHPDAAGIDVGASEIFVAVPSDRDPEPAQLRDVHQRPELTGGLAPSLRYSVGGDGVHECLLDTVAPDSGGSWDQSLFGKCPVCEECARPKDRCVGLPEDSVSPLGRALAS